MIIPSKSASVLTDEKHCVNESLLLKSCWLNLVLASPASEMNVLIAH